MVILVSKYDHRLVDLPYRHKSGELACDIPLVISNHPDNQPIADFYRVPFVVVPVSKDNKVEAEREILNWSRVTVSISWCWRVTCRSFRMSSLIGFRDALSISITRSCPRLLAPNHISNSPRREADRRNQSLRNGSARRRPHHRAGCYPYFSSRLVRRLVAGGPRPGKSGAFTDCARWHIENRILSYGNKTVVFD